MKCNFNLEGYLNSLKKELEEIEKDINYKYNNEGELHKKTKKNLKY